MSSINLEKVGMILKTRRMALGLSLRDVASSSGVATGTISQIETGKTSPNLTSLDAICNALKIPVSSLFFEEQQEKVFVIRKNERKSFVRNISNGKELIESLITPARQDIWGGMIEIPAKTDSGDFSVHDGEELVFVLEGEVTYELEHVSSYTLQQGDSIYYPNCIGHRWVNHTDITAKILIISTSPYNFYESE